MRIGYDAKRLFHNNTGLGYYSRTLIHSLKEEDPDFQASLFDAHPVKSNLTEPFYDSDKINIIRTGNPSWYYRSINLNKYLAGKGLQLFHGLSNELPYWRLPAGIPSVVTIHDVLFKSFLSDFPWHDRWIYEWKTQIALNRATQVIAISEATKQDILKYYKIDEKKIKVIFQSYDPIFDREVSESEQSEILNAYSLPSDYLLYVGSITYRKNLLVILKAIQSMSEGDRPPLVVLGRGTNYQKLIEAYIKQNKLEKWVYFLPDLPRMVIRILYAGAQLLIYPSLGEGFGLPVLEGIAANIPVITSRVSSLPEAGGDVALYFNPTDPEELKELILKINKQQFKNQIQGKRTEHLRKFNKSKIAGLYLREYERVRG